MPPCIWCVSEIVCLETFIDSSVCPIIISNSNYSNSSCTEELQCIIYTDSASNSITNSNSNSIIHVFFIRTIL